MHDVSQYSSPSTKKISFTPFPFVENTRRQVKLQMSSATNHNIYRKHTSIMTFATAASLLASRSAAFVTRPAVQSSTRAMSAFARTMVANAEEGQAEVVLVGCGAPNRGMGWYHGLQMVEKK